MNNNNIFKEKLAALMQQSSELSRSMENVLVDIVNSQGGHINLQELNHSPIYAFVYYSLNMQYIEVSITELNTKNDKLYITVEYPGWLYNGNEEFSIFGGEVIINATLYNICENIMEWIKE